MLKFKKSVYTIFLATLTILVGVFLWAGISGTRLLGDGKETYEPDGKSGPRTGNSTRTYHRFYHK